MELIYIILPFCIVLSTVSDDDCVQRTTKISTPTEIKYQYLDEYGIPAQGSLAINFQVKACNDAYLVVRTPETVSMQIILGGWDNTRSCIRILDTFDCLSTSIGGVLNCNEYRSFTVDWKGWEGRQITVSLGNTTSENPKTILSLLMSLRLSNVSIGISTGYGSSGQWLLQDSCQSAITTTGTAPNKEELTTKALAIIITGTSLTVLVIVAVAIGILVGLRYKRKRESQTNIVNSQYIVSSETIGQSDHPYATIT